jgi:hypothetical protein
MHVLGWSGPTVFQFWHYPEFVAQNCYFERRNKNEGTISENKSFFCYIGGLFSGIGGFFDRIIGPDHFFSLAVKEPVAESSRNDSSQDQKDSQFFAKSALGIVGVGFLLLSYKLISEGVDRINVLLVVLALPVSALGVILLLYVSGLVPLMFEYPPHTSASFDRRSEYIRIQRNWNSAT